MSCSTASRRTRARSRASTMLSHLITRSLTRLAHLRDGEGEPVPTLLLHPELLPPGPGQRVELGPAASLVGLPHGSDPPLLLDPVEGRVERALLHVEHLVRHLADALDRAVAVQRPEREGLEDEHVERALEQVGFGAGHVVTSGDSVTNEPTPKYSRHGTAGMPKMSRQSSIMPEEGCREVPERVL